ncbi:FecR family protein [Reyranella sp.]|uniref:FecR family protein n=1 Tax=Reyranella sp. TaxID=1929291 RepID=UPI003BACC728
MKTGGPADPLMREAIDWLIRLAEAPADAALRAAAEAWRGATPEHALAWKRAEKAWAWLGDPVPDRVAPGRDAAAVLPLPPTAPRRRRSAAGRRWQAGGIAAIAAALLVLWLPSLLPGLRADVATATAELREVVLEDGSTVTLAPQTALDVRFTESRREVALLAGEAFFSVTADRNRPFVVRAAGLAVRVTGTEFDVRLLGDALDVGVKHGSVEVEAAATTATAAVRLGPGDRLTVDRRSGTARRGSVPPEDVGSWREHRLFVEQATVAEVVEVLRRYRSGWIVLADDGLARRQVAGLYDLRDPDQALRILVGPFGGRVREVTPLLRIVSGP